MVQKEGVKRGRPRSYDPDTALAQAMAVFWNAGYAGTSLDDITAGTGLNRPSLYGAFGDKHALYLQALERYRSQGRDALIEALARDRAAARGVASRLRYGTVVVFFRRTHERAAAFSSARRSPSSSTIPLCARLCTTLCLSSMPRSRRGSAMPMTITSCRAMPIRRHSRRLPPRCCTRSLSAPAPASRARRWRRCLIQRST